MLSAPKFVTRPDQPFAAIRVTLDRGDLPTKAPPLIGEVAGWLQSQGVEPAGAPFFNYLDMGDRGGVPVRRLTASPGDSAAP